MRARSCDTAAIVTGARRYLRRNVLASQRSGHSHDKSTAWFWDHYDQAAGEIVSFLDGLGVSLEGRRVADVGCGDGIMALGLFNRARPAELIGYDVNLTDTQDLLRRARAQRVVQTLPHGLRFEMSENTRIPAADSWFDVVYTWSAFEHIAKPAAVLSEIRRILKPEGVLFLQLWPFFYSERGSHLWDWFPEGFHHLLEDEDEIVESMRREAIADRDRTEYMATEFRNLNRITLDELGADLANTGLTVVALEPLAHRVLIPRGLATRHSLSALGIAGVKLVAVPAQ
jgi:ubiquinone/menaquinone biosynthesis C-methylase UbiE